MPPEPKPETQRGSKYLYSTYIGPKVRIWEQLPGPGDHTRTETITEIRIQGSGSLLQSTPPRPPLPVSSESMKRCPCPPKPQDFENPMVGTPVLRILVIVSCGAYIDAQSLTQGGSAVTFFHAKRPWNPKPKPRVQKHLGKPSNSQSTPNPQQELRNF